MIDCSKEMKSHFQNQVALSNMYSGSAEKTQSATSHRNCHSYFYMEGQSWLEILIKC
jgi:hypothetical protein